MYAMFPVVTCEIHCFCFTQNRFAYTLPVWTLDTIFKKRFLYKKYYFCCEIIVKKWLYCKEAMLNIYFIAYDCFQ